MQSCELFPTSLHPNRLPTYHQILKYPRSHYIIRDLRDRPKINRRPIPDHGHRKITYSGDHYGTRKVPRRCYPHPCVSVNSTDAHKPLTKHRTVRYLPDWFPGTKFKTLAREVRERYQASTNGPMEYVKSVMKVGSKCSLRSDCV